MTQPDRGTSPLPGESTLGLNVMLGLTAISVVALIAAAIARANGPTLWGLVALVVVSVGGLAYQVRVRAKYLARVKNGDMIEREPWTGADIL